MKKEFLFVGVIVVVIIAGIFIFSPKKSLVENKKIEVAATIFPIYDMARVIAGENIHVRLIVPSGTSPHAFDVSAQTVKELQASKALFYIGYGVDNWATSVVESIPGMRTVIVDKDITLRESHDEEDGPIDPHYWLDPENATIIAATIAEELSVLDPEHTAQYLLRKDQFIEDIAKHDTEWQALLEPFTKRDILTFHDAFYYFADHFDLNVIATFEPFVGKEPGPQYLANLHQTVKKYGINVLFIEPQLSHAALDAFANDVGATIGVLDEMGGADGKTSYVELIDANVKEIIRALEASQ